MSRRICFRLIALIVWLALPVALKAEPVIFGNTLDGANSVSGINGWSYASYVPTDHYTSQRFNDTIRAVYSYMTGSGNFQLGLYEVSGGEPADFTGYNTNDIASGTGWKGEAGLAWPMDSGKTYTIVLSNVDAGAVALHFEGSHAGGCVEGDDDFPDPWNESGKGWTDNGSFSMYAVFDRGGATWFVGSGDVDDSWLDSGNDLVNYHTDTVIQVGYSAENYRATFHFPNYDDSVPNGYRADSAILEIFCQDNISVGNIGTYYIVKPYDFDQITYQCWQGVTGDPTFLRQQWGAAGAEDTGSVINSEDESGDDRGGTSMSSVTIAHPADSNWLSIPLDTTWINQKWALASDSNGGILIKTAGADTISLAFYMSTDHAERIALRPRLRVQWGLIPVPGEAVYTRNRHGHGNLHGGKDEYTGHGP